MSDMNVLLLGDSIRMGYQDYVREKLSDGFDVFFAKDNGRFSTHFYWYMRDWCSDRHYDVVHLNFGLWDIVRLAGEDQCFTSENVYRECCERVLSRLRLYWGINKLIFALTTAVREPCVVEPVDGIEVGIRRNIDIRRYNDIVRDVADELPFHVEINDLYAVSAKFSGDMYLDDTHFNQRGFDKLGEIVSKRITEVVGK